MKQMLPIAHTMRAVRRDLRAARSDLARAQRRVDVLARLIDYLTFPLTSPRGRRRFAPVQALGQQVGIQSTHPAAGTPPAVDAPTRCPEGTSRSRVDLIRERIAKARAIPPGLRVVR